MQKTGYSDRVYSLWPLLVICFQLALKSLFNKQAVQFAGSKKNQNI